MGARLGSINISLLTERYVTPSNSYSLSGLPPAFAGKRGENRCSQQQGRLPEDALDDGMHRLSSSVFNLFD